MAHERVARRTDELVIGFVGAIGAGVSTTAELLRKELTDTYGYRVEIIRVSDIIREYASRHLKRNDVSAHGVERITGLQECGTELRRRFGPSYLAEKIVEEIHYRRSKKDDGFEEISGSDLRRPKTLRVARIVDSLKRPEESRLLEDVYGGAYWQFTIFAPKTVRKNRLMRQGIETSGLGNIFDRDENDIENKHGQSVRDTALLSHFFIRNDGNNSLIDVIKRHLQLIFGIGVETPTRHEAGMHAAFSAMTRSACLSRQVGAAVFSESGELLGIGWNDVPRYGGGLYINENPNNMDNRCYIWRDRMCHNDFRKNKLIDNIVKNICEAINTDSLKIDDSELKEKLRNILKGTHLWHITEYSRAIHAEMEAILSCARNGNKSLVGGTLYTTTFPCHNCARHIVAAGIKKVYYVEPYEKSLALELHNDAISTTQDSGNSNKVLFLQYEGVGPRRMTQLFTASQRRKNTSGKVCSMDPKQAKPILAQPIDGFTTHEKRVIERLHNNETSANGRD
ncbi:MAG: deoxycytidylate deaminase [Gammaproteobacteria bacterium]|nr:MAG: deoxycytidylate deaminase [Gammaproteobacteria bacterium]